MKLQNVSSSIDCECPIICLRLSDSSTPSSATATSASRSMKTNRSSTRPGAHGPGRRLVEEMLAYVCHVDNIVI